MDLEWGTASCPRAFRILTNRDPMRPVPPMTAIFMPWPSCSSDTTAFLLLGHDDMHRRPYARHPGPESALAPDPGVTAVR